MKYLIILLLLFSCSAKKELGSRSNPIKLFFTPSVDSGTITTNSEVFVRYMEEKTGHFFKVTIPTSYIAVVEAFGSERADIAIMNSFGYLMANQKYGVNAELKVVRYGEDFYQGQIVANLNSGIKKLEDIKDKKFAFTDASSTSGYIFPLKLLQENGIQLKNKIFAMKHDNVISMVYQGQVDAGATFYSAPAEDGTIRDARRLVKTQYPDVADKVKIIAITEKIPNDPVVFRKNLSKKIKEDFKNGLKSFFATPEGKEVFFKSYSFEGVVDATDQDYDSLRETIKLIDLKLEKLLK